MLNKITQILKTLPVVLGVLVVSIPIAAYATNKVVVIPMAGDDIIPAPFEPVATESPPNSDYDYSNGTTVVDKVTGLEWQRQDDNTERTWNDADSYCANLTLDNKTDWRLPGRLELQSIVYYGTFNPAINSVAFPSTNASYYWSASSLPGLVTLAFRIVFDVGRVTASSKTISSYVRCVR